MSGSDHRLDRFDRIVFGNNQHFAENLSPLSTTSPLFTTWFSIVTSPLSAGTYRVGGVFQYEGTTGITTGEYQILMDGVTILDLETLSIASAGERKTYANFGQLVLTAGVHTLDIQVRRTSVSGVFTVDDGKIELWRVI